MYSGNQSVSICKLHSNNPPSLKRVNLDLEKVATTNCLDEIDVISGY